ncbi:MAG: FecR family protein [Alphaproteobacteria bacterium]|mgnify:CR=1 FL=1|jgi:hypothetical protein|nr:FecR family protein [Alphaproteobacteria bacterium]
MATTAQAAEGEIGQVKTVAGEAYLVHDGDRTDATPSAAVFENDMVETGADGSIGITFNDNTVISAGPNTELAFDEYSYDPSTLEGSMLADLLSGTLAVDSGDMVRASPDAMRVKTPSAILGVRGTKFLIRVGAEGGQ